jgi:hypothetical protein
MKKGLATLSMAFLALWPFSSSADQDVQARFEKSLNDTKSIPNVEIEWLDTLTLQDPAMLKAMNGKVFSRTFQYSFIASGPKYRSKCKLVSGTQTNLMKLSESGYDGKTYFYYSGDNRYMTTSSVETPAGNAESSCSLLTAPFMFLTKQSDDRMLRFTEFYSLGLTNKVTFQPGQKSNGLLEVAVSGLPLGGQPTTYVIGIDEVGDSFTPTMIKGVTPGRKMEGVYRLLNYTNLGAYHFPSKIEWTWSSYPPTSPPNLVASGMMEMISARTPDQIADSVFKMDSEQKGAVTVWDSDQQKLIKSAPRDPKLITSCMTRTNVLK